MALYLYCQNYLFTPPTTYMMDNKCEHNHLFNVSSISQLSFRPQLMQPLKSFYVISNDDAIKLGYCVRIINKEQIDFVSINVGLPHFWLSVVSKGFTVVTYIAS